MPTSSSSPLLSVADRLYRALLVAYLTAFRRAYGPDLVQLFHDCSRGLCGGTVRAA